MECITNYVLRVFKDRNFPTLNLAYNELDYSSSEEALNVAKSVAEKYNKKGYSYCIIQETSKINKMVISDDHRDIALEGEFHKTF